MAKALEAQTLADALGEAKLVAISMPFIISLCTN